MNSRIKITFFRIFSILFLLIPCFFSFYGCSSQAEKTEISISDDGYWIIDGIKTDKKAIGKDGVDGIDGKDSDLLADFTLQEIYNTFVSNGYEKDFESFFKEYFQYSTDFTLQTTQSVRPSIVSVINNYNESKPKRGSGVVIKKDNLGNAYILTNYHVCYPGLETTTFTLFLSSDEKNERQIPATYVGGYESIDLAILKVEECQIINEAKVATLATENALDGTSCIAIGNPFSRGIAVTSGVVSIDSEQVTYNAGTSSKARTVLRHTAFIAKGSSGGGLFNLAGELIGITCAGETANEKVFINYAIPIEIVNSFVNEVLNNSQ